MGAGAHGSALTREPSTCATPQAVDEVLERVPGWPEKGQHPWVTMRCHGSRHERKKRPHDEKDDTDEASVLAHENSPGSRRRAEGRLRAL